jgi:hypothetical protein
MDTEEQKTQSIVEEQQPKADTELSGDEQDTEAEVEEEGGGDEVGDGEWQSLMGKDVKLRYEHRGEGHSAGMHSDVLFDYSLWSVQNDERDALLEEETFRVRVGASDVSPGTPTYMHACMHTFPWSLGVRWNAAQDWNSLCGTAKKATLSCYAPLVGSDMLQRGSFAMESKLCLRTPILSSLSTSEKCTTQRYQCLI